MSETPANPLPKDQSGQNETAPENTLSGEAVIDGTVPVHHLHPLTLILNFVSLLPQLVYVLPAMYFGMRDGGSIFILPALLVLFGIGMGIAWIRWKRFSYQFTDEEVRIASGVFSRNNRSIPYERIQDVNVEQKLVARILGLASVKFETGSAGDGNDGELNAVSLTEADRMREIIRQRKAGVVTPDSVSDAVIASDQAAGKAATPPIFAMDNRRIFIAGLFNFSLVIFAVLGAAAQNLDFLIPGEVFNRDFWLDRINSDGARDQLNSIGLISQIFGALAAVIGLIVIGLASGQVTTFFREYGFRLDRTETGLRRRRGLTTLTDMAMPLHRIQAASIITGPIKKRFGWHILKFQSLASDGKNESDHAVAPLAQQDELDRIMAEPDIKREAGADYNPVTSAYWTVPAVMLSLLIVIADAALAIFVDIRLAWFALIALPVIAIMWLRWRHHHYVLSHGQLFVREGFWRQKLTILPVRKVQSVDISQSFLGRSMSYASVVIGVAGGSGILPLTVHDMPEDESQKLRARLLAPIV